MSFATNDADLFGNDIEWTKSTGTRRVCWSLPTERKIRVRFCSDPATMAGDSGWALYREVNAFNGLIGGAELPNGLKEFPVDDYEIVNDPETGRKLKQRKRDDILAKVRPSKWDIERAEKDDRTPYASATDRVITSVIYLDGELEKKKQYNPPAGEQVMLKMSKSRYLDLKAAFEMYKDVDETFTPVGTVWDLEIEGKGTNARLIAKRVKDAPPADDLPNPRNVVEYINDLRAQVEAFVATLDNAFVSTMTDEPSTDEPAGNPMGDDPTWNSEDDADAPAAKNTTDWTSIAPAAIKAKLKSKGFDVPARIRNDELIELAKEHLDAEVAA